MIIRPLLAAVAMLLALSASSAVASETCTLRFAWTEWAPYHFRDQNGRQTGIDHALTTEAARRMGCKLEWLEMPRSRAVAMLREGRVDAIAGMGLTQDRLEFSLFSAPLRPGRNVLLVRRGESTRFPFSSLEELSDSQFRLGVLAGARYSQEYERLLDAGRLADNNVGMPNFEAALSMLIRDRIDGFIIGDQVARHLADRQGRGDEVEFHPMPIHTSAAHVMFSRRAVNGTTVIRFDDALAEMEADGTSHRILNAASYGSIGSIGEAAVPVSASRAGGSDSRTDGSQRPPRSRPRSHWPRASAS